ncbi:MAG TPA: iron-sulfur cluster assembly accessory protein [Anaeromyxobacter sp.]|nr:iron-sulfur cluster assembly accessory protein [Anaeromyxobacter sp.]
MASIDITPAAALRIRALGEEKGTPGGGLRLGVQGGGCSGFSYLIDWEGAPGEKDLVFERDGGRIFVDPRSARFLDGTVVDFERTLLKSGFVFKNPNVKSSCGCGESFAV